MRVVFDGRTGARRGGGARGLALPLVCALLGACAGGPEPRAETVPPAERPDPAELRQRYNARVERLQRVWARAVVELSWRSREGRRHEQGEGHLLVERPEKLALSVGKLGHTIFWSGTDGERQWLFDLSGDEKVLYLGETAKGERAGPFGVPPRALLWLLGLRPIGPSDASWRAGRYVYALADRPLEIALDPRTALPERVTWRPGAAKGPRAVARLARPERVELAGAPPGAWPRVPSSIEIETKRPAGSARITLSALTDDPDRFGGRAFDLEALREAFAPDRVLPFSSLRR